MLENFAEPVVAEQLDCEKSTINAWKDLTSSLYNNNSVWIASTQQRFQYLAATDQTKVVKSMTDASMTL